MQNTPVKHDTVYMAQVTVPQICVAQREYQCFMQAGMQCTFCVL
jgi:hypothetical protein